MKSLLLTMATTLAAANLHAALPPIEVANKVATAVKIEAPSIAPIIDGEMDDVWMDAPENTIASFIPNGTSFTEPTSAADLSGKWRALWDANNLYIYIVVMDDALVLAPNNSFEIFTSTAYSRVFGHWGNSGYNHVSDAHLIFNVGATPVRAVAGLFSVDSQIDPFPSTTKVKATATGYAAEVALTWSSLNKQGPNNAVTWDSDAGLFIGGPSEYPSRNFIGLELYLQDDDDGGYRDTKVAWFGGPIDRHGDFAWADTLVWGTLELGYYTPPLDPPIIGSACPTQWTVYDGGFKWNAGTDFIYDGFFPFVYDFASNNWFYVFSDANTDETVGYFIYDFGRTQFGWLSCDLYATGYQVLPAGTSFIKLSATSH
ncbi:MAG: sugar-binding protein [Verrucomicrobiota bacterium]|nr:sugar-binding protein [Verrucomicrobiota bacterium]